MNANREDWSPSDEKLKKIIDEVRENDPSFWNEEFPTETDLSFLYEPQAKKKSTRRRLLNAAAMIAVVLTLSGGMAVWLNSDASYAFRFELKKLFYEAKGKLTTGEEYKSDEGFLILTIDSMENIDNAKSFLPSLLVPDYICEGFTLTELEISIDAIGGYLVSYEFQNDRNNYINIIIINVEDPDTVVDTYLESERMDFTDRTIYYERDDAIESQRVVFLENNILVSLSASNTIDKEAIINMALSLE